MPTHYLGCSGETSREEMRKMNGGDMEKENPSSYLKKSREMAENVWIVVVMVKRKGNVF